MKYLLDTNICIHFLKDEHKVKNTIKKLGFRNCYFSEITILELLYGIENSYDSKKELNRQAFEQFYALIKNNIILINNSFKTFAIEKAKLKKKGQLIADFDLLIGATAIANNLILVTRNVKHFKRLSNIKIENWIDNK